jgi:hypothetical protein
MPQPANTFGQQIKRLLVEILSRGIWILYRYEPDATEGPRHRLKAGLAIVDEDDITFPYLVNRFDRREDPNDGDFRPY